MMGFKSKKEKPIVASKVKTSRKNKKRFFNPGSIWAKRKKGRIVRQDIGPQNAEMSINQRPLHLSLSITSKDGLKVSGDLVIKYNVVDVNRYFERLNAWENSMEDLQNDMAYELNAELSSYGMSHEKPVIMKDRDALVAEIQTTMSPSFREMGIRPYKIFPVWTSVNPVVEKGLYDTIQKEVEGYQAGIEKEVNTVKQSNKQLEEKLNYSAKQVEDNIEKLNKLNELGEISSEMQERLVSLREVIENQKGEISSMKQVLTTLSSTSERPEIADYLHEQGMNIAMSQPAVYNKGGRGPEFIEEFTKEGLSLYEKLMDPRNAFGDEVIESLAKRAYQRVMR